MNKADRHPALRIVLWELIARNAKRRTNRSIIKSLNPTLCRRSQVAAKCLDKASKIIEIRMFILITSRSSPHQSSVVLKRLNFRVLEKVLSKTNQDQIIYFNFTARRLKVLKDKAKIKIFNTQSMTYLIVHQSKVKVWHTSQNLDRYMIKQETSGSKTIKCQKVSKKWPLLVDRWHLRFSSRAWMTPDWAQIHQMYTITWFSKLTILVRWDSAHLLQLGLSFLLTLGNRALVMP